MDEAIANESVDRISAGERGADLHEVSGSRVRWGYPPGNETVCTAARCVSCATPDGWHNWQN
jgi:hypothetical protein